jgi:hypothetical protein
MNKQKLSQAIDLCSILLVDNCYDTILLFIHCNLSVDNIGVLCQASRDVVHYTNIKAPQDIFSHFDIDLNKIFACLDRTYILMHHTCDGHIDCPDGLDEQMCSHVCSFHHSSLNEDYHCFKSCHESNCTCSPLYYQCMFSGGCIPRSKICDCHPDCQDHTDESDTLCSYNTCYDIAPVFNNPTVSPKIDARFYCPPFYISLHEICDGKSDCQHGEDEMFDCDNLSIVPSFRCPRETVFIGYNQISDKTAQCTSSFDDELFSLVNRKVENSSCIVHGLAVFCNNTGEFLPFSNWTRALTVFSTPSSLCSFELIIKSIHHLSYLLILQINGAKTSSLKGSIFVTLTRLTILDLSRNQIKLINQNTFDGLVSLHQLDLDMMYLVGLVKYKTFTFHKIHFKRRDFPYMLSKCYLS